MLCLINKFKPAFNINKAANIWRIEFKKVVIQVKNSIIINKFKPALNNAMLQKSVHCTFKTNKAKIKK